MRIADAGNWAIWSDDENIIGAGSLGDIEESEIQSGNRVVKISEDQAEILEMGSAQSPDRHVVKMHGSVNLSALSGAAAEVQLLGRLLRSLRGISDGLGVLLIGVDVGLGSLFWTPTELDVVPSVGVEDAVDGHFRLPGILLRGNGENELAILVLDVHPLTAGLSLAAAGGDVRSILKRLVETQPEHDGEALVLRMLFHDVVPELGPFLENEELQTLAVDLNGFANNAVNVGRIPVHFQAELTTWNIAVLDLFESQNCVADVSLAGNQEFELSGVGRRQLVLLAVKTSPVGVTFARVGVDLVNTSAVAVTRFFVQQTLVDVDLTVGSRESSIAMTQVFSDQILAIPVDARIICTIINVGLAMFSCKSGGTATFIGIDSINTFALIKTRIAGAVINVNLAMFSSKADSTGADVLVDAI